MNNENQTNMGEIGSGEPEENKQAKETVKRPILLSILCIMGFFGIAINGLQYVSNINTISSLYGEFFPIVVLFVLAIKLWGLIGLWKMRVWGVYIFMISVILDLGATLLFVGEIKVIGFVMLIVPILIIIYGFSLINKGYMIKGFFPEEEEETLESEE